MRHYLKERRHGDLDLFGENDAVIPALIYIPKQETCAGACLETNTQEHEKSSPNCCIPAQTIYGQRHASTDLGHLGGNL